MTQEVEHKTTAISDDRFHPLEVEWSDHEHRYRVINGQSVMLPVHQVSLVSPSSAFGGRRTRIVNLSSQTALNLLAWLKQEEERLREEAQKEQERMQNVE